MGYTPTKKLEAAGATLKGSAIPFRIERMLGRGGIADVFLATDVHLKCPVAIKQLRINHVIDGGQAPGNNSIQANVVERFVREWQAMGQLDHPHIVRARTAGINEGRPYLVMDYMAGGDLETHLQEHGLPSLKQACKWMLDVCRGLDYAHSHGWIHRDLKPSNLLLDQRGELKLADFGIAYCEQNPAERVTMPGIMMGTPDFIAPEQIENFASADARADIYSLGCTFYQILFGEPPFGRSNSLYQKLIAHREGNLTFPWHTRNEPVSAQKRIEALIRRMLAKDPNARPHAVINIAEDIESLSQSTPRWKLHRDNVLQFLSEPRQLAVLASGIGLVLFISLAIAGSVGLMKMFSDSNDQQAKSGEQTRTVDTEVQSNHNAIKSDEKIKQRVAAPLETVTDTNTNPSTGSNTGSNAGATVPVETETEIVAARSDFDFQFSLQNDTDFKAGEPIHFCFATERDCLVYVFFNNELTGETELIIPNPKLERCEVLAMNEVVIPEETAFYQLQAMEPPGPQQVLVLAISDSSEASMKLPTVGEVNQMLGSIRLTKSSFDLSDVKAEFLKRWPADQVVESTQHFSTY